jgi:alkylated DNA repair dioxygenase AlkB
LGEAFEAVRSLVDAPFNRVGLNLYRDEGDSVALHSDKTDKLVPAQPIAIVSLGASRRMSIRPKTGAGRTIHVELEPGSCLVMSYASQFTHVHGIPKLAGVSGPRISLAFRCFTG